MVLRKSTMSALPPSPLARFLERRSGQLRTAFSPWQCSADPDSGIDRSAAAAVRAACRSGTLKGQTAGMAPGHLQANFVALPQAHAFDFLAFALRNPQACPLLAVTAPGQAEPAGVAPGADLRSDLPLYRVYRNGVMSDEVTDVSTMWGEDMIGFLLGCSFTWEGRLAEAGLCPRQIEENKNVPMFRTNVRNVPFGAFGGDLVVSMRPYRPDQVERVSALTARFPGAHGGPIHWGDPAALGIADLKQVDFGEPVTVREGEVPVFWCCGVTPQTAIMEAGLPLAITHAPGHMFVCDVLDREMEQPALPGFRESDGPGSVDGAAASASASNT